MRYDVLILRAMLRLARQRQAADGEALHVRVGGTRASVRASLRRLEADGLVERMPALDGDRARLTLAGFAIAVATVKLGLAPRASARRAA